MNAIQSPLLFQWAPPRRRARALVIFLIVSFLLHAAGFYIFQIVYPPTVTLIPPPARLNLLSPDNPESVAFLRWIEAEDPALTTTTQRAPDSRSYTLPPLEHHPSYATHQPEFKMLPERSVDLTIPSSIAIGDIRAPRPKMPPLIVAQKTTAQFADAASELGPASFPDFVFHFNRPDAPANARYRVAIAKNSVIHCFLIESSGDPTLDEEARNFLLLSRFPAAAAGGETLWTTATILWGNDLVLPRPSPSPTPAP